MQVSNSMQSGTHHKKSKHWKRPKFYGQGYDIQVEMLSEQLDIVG